MIIFRLVKLSEIKPLHPYGVISTELSIFVIKFHSQLKLLFKALNGFFVFLLKTLDISDLRIQSHDS